MEGFQITVGPIKTDNIYLGICGDQQSDLNWSGEIVWAHDPDPGRVAFK